MGQAEKFLNSLTDDDQLDDRTPHSEHTVADPDPNFVIDPDTRKITNGSFTKNVLMQYDHNSEIYTFEIPRYIEGHDMVECNRVLVHYNNIDTKNDKEYPGVYEMTDLSVSEDNPDKVISTWLISGNATQVAGTLSFLVQYLCVTEDGTIDYEWHTDIYDSVDIKPSRMFSKQVVGRHVDILEQWRQRLFDAGDSVITTAEDSIEAIVAEGAAQIDAITTKGNEILDNLEDNLNNKPTYNIDNDTLVTTDEDVLKVNVADKVEADNGLPVSSAAVYNALGVIENGSY